MCFNFRFLCVSLFSEFNSNTLSLCNGENTNSNEYYGHLCAIRGG